jgi:hypothetical protein
MATLQKQIADKFLEDLSHGKDVDAAQIDEIRKLFSGDKKIKAEDLVKVFSLPHGGDDFK